jgi:hypothetical protein
MVPMEMGIDLEGEEPGEVSKCMVGIVGVDSCGRGEVEQLLLICCACGRSRPGGFDDVETRRMWFASRSD